VFLMLVGVGHGLGRVIRFGNVLRLPTRRILDVCWWEGVWCAVGDLLLVTLGVVCVGGFAGVFWLGVLPRFARGDGGGIVMPLFRVWLFGVSIGYALGGGVLWAVGEVGVICASRFFVSAGLSPCSFRMSDALCNEDVNWLVHI
jgi:hypothetical protein